MCLDIAVERQDRRKHNHRRKPVRMEGLELNMVQFLQKKGKDSFIGYENTFLCVLFVRSHVPQHPPFVGGRY